MWPNKVYAQLPPYLSNRCLISIKAKFLRSHHPEVDIPFELLKAELQDSEKTTEELSRYDPMQGNAIDALYCLESQRTRSLALAFPTGPLSNELSM